jgi:hypothetical protein
LSLKNGYLGRYTLIYGQEKFVQKVRSCAWQEEFNFDMTRKLLSSTGALV